MFSFGFITPLQTHPSWPGHWHISSVHHPLHMGCFHSHRGLKFSLIENGSYVRHLVCTHCRHLGQAPAEDTIGWTSSLVFTVFLSEILHCKAEHNVIYLRLWSEDSVENALPPVLVLEQEDILNNGRQTGFREGTIQMSFKKWCPFSL